MLHARIIPLTLENCWEFTRAFYQRCIGCHRLLTNWYWARKNHNPTKCTPPTSPFLSIWSFSNGISWYHPPVFVDFRRISGQKTHHPSTTKSTKIGHASPNFTDAWNSSFPWAANLGGRWAEKAFRAPKVGKANSQLVSFSSPIHFSRRWEAVQLRGRS